MNLVNVGCFFVAGEWRFPMGFIHLHNVNFFLPLLVSVLGQEPAGEFGISSTRD